MNKKKLGKTASPPPPDGVVSSRRPAACTSPRKPCNCKEPRAAAYDSHEEKRKERPGARIVSTRENAAEFPRQKHTPFFFFHTAQPVHLCPLCVATSPALSHSSLLTALRSDSHRLTNLTSQRVVVGAKVSHMTRIRFLAQWSTWAPWWAR